MLNQINPHIFSCLTAQNSLVSLPNGQYNGRPMKTNHAYMMMKNYGPTNK